MHRSLTSHDHTDRHETAHASLCWPFSSDSTKPAFKVATHAPSNRTARQCSTSTNTSTAIMKVEASQTRAIASRIRTATRPTKPAAKAAMRPRTERRRSGASPEPPPVLELRRHVRLRPRQRKVTRYSSPSRTVNLPLKFRHQPAVSSWKEEDWRDKVAATSWQSRA